MKKSFFQYIFLSLIMILAGAFSSDAQSLLPSGNSISADSLKKHVKFLASDELKGRKAGSEGDSLAAFYINGEFQRMGLTPVFNNGIQYFSLVTEVKPGSDNKLKIQPANKEVGKHDTEEFISGKDFMPFSFSTSATLTGPVIFAGFGITAETDSLKWDDYNNVDVTGKWVLVLRGDPEPDNPTSAFIPMSSDRAKALYAKDKKAGGILLVSPSSIDRSDKPIDITFDKSVSDAGIPVISITRKVAADILGYPVTAIDSLEKVMLKSKAPVRINTDKVLTATTDIVRQKATSRNVSYMIKGSNPKLANQYIVIGAHYDHLGMGGDGSGSRVPDTVAVHYGADDNASGVASLIELARFFSKKENQPERNLIFTAFGAEEMGIIGSRYFTEHSPVPMKSIIAMVNKIGRAHV